MAVWLKDTIKIKLEKTNPEAEWAKLAPYLAQSPESQVSTFKTMMSKWLFDPFGKYVSCGCSPLLSIDFPRIQERFIGYFTSGCKYNSEINFTANAKTLLALAVETSERTYNPLPSSITKEEFMALAAGLDQVDRAILDKMESLFKGTRFTGSHMKNAQEVCPRRDAAAATPSSTFQVIADDEEVEEIVLDSGRPTPSAAEMTGVLASVTNRPKRRPNRKSQVGDAIKSLQSQGAEKEDDEDKERKRQKWMLEKEKLEKEQRLQELMEEKMSWELRDAKRNDERREMEHKIAMARLRRQLQQQGLELDTLDEVDRVV
jgi:hypothetical protein